MQKVLLTATIAISLTVSTIVIIWSLDGLTVCVPSFESNIRYQISTTGFFLAKNTNIFNALIVLKKAIRLM